MRVYIRVTAAPEPEPTLHAASSNNVAIGKRERLLAIDVSVEPLNQAELSTPRGKGTVEG